MATKCELIERFRLLMAARQKVRFHFGTSVKLNLDKISDRFMFDFYPESINQTPLPLQIDNIFVCNSLLYLFFRSTATLQRRWLNWDGNSPKHTIYCTHKMDWNVCVKEGTERKRLRNNRFHVNSLLPSKVIHTHTQMKV